MTELPRTIIITQREISVEISKKSERSIFTPTKNRTIATPYFR